MRSNIWAANFTVFLAFGSPVLADENRETPEVQKEKATKFLSFGTPNGLSFSLSSEDSKGKLGANFVRSDNIYGLSLTGKLKDNVGEFVNLDGIDANTKVTGSWSHLFVQDIPVSDPTTIIFSEDSQKYADFALKECQIRNKQMAADGLSAPDDCSIQAQLVSKLIILTFSGDDGLKVSRLAHEINKQCQANSKQPWAARYDIPQMCKTTAMLMTHLRSGMTGAKPVITEFGVFSASVSYFQSKFNWLDLDNLATNKRGASSTEEGYDITMSYAHVDAPNSFKWEAGVTYQQGYANDAANTERELCFGFDSDPLITECTKGFLLPPVKKKTVTPFVKLTHQLNSDSLFKAVGLDIKYTFEDQEKQDGSLGGLDRWTIETPFHIVSLMDKKISAGIKFSWVSKVKKNEDPFKAVIFVSAPLTIF